MSNHFHLVLYYDPNAAQTWSDEEVADRWLHACPPKLKDGSVDASRRELIRTGLLANPPEIENLRQKLGSLSVFMKLLKQPISRRANLEDNCTGHFFEQRFYSGALLSESAVLAAMAYVDLNPIRARIARSIEESEHNSISERLESRAEDIKAYLRPVSGGILAAPPFNVTLSDYIDHLNVLVPDHEHTWASSKLSRWRDQVATIKKPQRGFGPESVLKKWITDRGWQFREAPMPS